MVEPGPRREQAAGPRIDAVEILPTDLRFVLLRVAGAWESPPPPGVRAAVLVLRDPGGEQRIEALAQTSRAAARSAPGPHPLRAAFSVPEALAPLLGPDAAGLDLGPVTIRLPAPAPPADEAEDAEGTVVDPAVLAERRARRAEQAERAEQANGRRAGEAEHAVARLEGELGKLELRLAATTAERAQLALSLSVGALHGEVELARTRAPARAAPAAPATATGPVQAAALARERRLAATAPDRLEVGRLRAEADARGRALEAAEHAIADARDTVADVHEQLDRERAQRATESEEREPVERERRELAARLAVLGRRGRELAERVESERDARRAAELELELERVRIGALERSRAEREARESAWAAGRVALEESVDALRTELLGARAESERQVRGHEALTRERDAFAAERDALVDERDGLADQLEHARRDLGDGVAAERARFEAQLSVIEGTVAELRSELTRAGAALHAGLRAERVHGRAAEAAASQTAERLADAERRLADADRRLAEGGALKAGADDLIELLQARLERAEEPGEPSAPSWLEVALRRLSRTDEAAAARLALELLPGQALAVAAPLDYDLEAEGLGRQRVTVGSGAGELAPLDAPRSRRSTDFRVRATPAGLVGLVLAGGAPRPAGVRIAGTLRRRRARRALPAVPLRLAALASAGVLPQPGLLYRALAEAIDPEWTRGHRFTIVLEIDGPRGGVWSVSVDDGAPLAVRDGRPAGAANATVRTTQVGLQHLLDGEPPPRDDRAAIRGEPAVVGLLGRWTERARRRGGAAA